ncbi:hypothetical protein SAMN03159338_1565 [Sphingomonas sp. NFR04]|nr:hypothetical protein SAMN03159338_1565 [Sphingomonas sp. NFR04]
MEVPPCPCCGGSHHHTWEPEFCPVINPSPRRNRRALLQSLKGKPGITKRVASLIEKETR